MNLLQFWDIFYFISGQMIECRSTQSSVTILGNEELGYNYDSIMNIYEI